MEKNKLSADEALAILKEGNERFVKNELKHPNLDVARRQMLREGQAPHTVVLTCADSRLVPDLIFDQGLGDLFTIRVAGNVAKEKVLGSIEYAVANLGTKLVIVLGHESCGAVTAALEPAEVEGHVGAILEELKPAVFAARQQQGDLLENAIKNNAIFMKERIKDSMPVLNRAVRQEGVKVVSAYYSLGNGEVSWI
ncbi:MAG: carbonic anhydrase [Vicingaceae bacterium]